MLISDVKKLKKILTKKRKFSKRHVSILGLSLFAFALPFGIPFFGIGFGIGNGPDFQQPATVSAAPKPSCIPRPWCLDHPPICYLMVPYNFCPPSISPSPIISTHPSPTPPQGCYYQKRICTIACPVTNPDCCPPILICPTGGVTPTPPPGCFYKPDTSQCTLHAYNNNPNSQCQKTLICTSIIPQPHPSIALSPSPTPPPGCTFRKICTLGIACPVAIPDCNCRQILVCSSGVPQPSKTISSGPTLTPPSGCFYKQLQCLRPCAAGDNSCCPSILVCPSGSPSPQLTCIPRPPCLDATPRCMLAVPEGGWCPPTVTPVISQPPLPPVVNPFATWWNNLLNFFHF